MFQQGGMVTPSMPLPPSGGIVDGLGLNAPEAMPPIPPQDQEILTEGISDMAVKLGQVDAAEDTASLINAIRSDNATIDDRYTELARYVGREDATKTPESVLTLVQPTFELIEQGGGMNMLGSDLLQGTGPMEESMSATLTETPMGDTATMTETMETPTLFNKGGLAVKKSKAPVYRSNGSPMIGEMITDYTQGSPYRFGEVMKTFTGEPRQQVPQPLFSSQQQSPMFQRPYADLDDAPYNKQFALRDTIEQQRRQSQLNAPAEQAAQAPSYSDILANARLNANRMIPVGITEAGLQETFGTVDPRSATDIYGESLEMVESSDLLPTQSAEDYKTTLESLMAPSREPDKTAEEIMQERKDFIGEMDRSPEALFALAQSFNQLAQTPGTFLQGVAAFGGDAAERLSPMIREQELLDQQLKVQAFDEYQALQQRLRDEDRGIAMSAFEMFRDDEKGNRGFKQSLMANALSQAATEAQTAQELAFKIKELGVTLGVDYSNAQVDALMKAYAPMLEEEVDGQGRIYRQVPGSDGVLRKTYVGIIGQDGNRNYNRKHALRGGDPLVVLAAEDAVPEFDIASMDEEQLQDIKQNIFQTEKAINAFEELFANARDEDGNLISEKMGTGPGSVMKAIATGSLGAFGADWATWVDNELNQKALREAARSFIAANALSDRYALGEQQIINDMLNIEAKFFADPETAWHRIKDITGGLINNNEYNHAIMEGRAPARLVKLASATTNDPVDYSNINFRNMLGIAAEQGRSWNGFVSMDADEATLADPAINPNGVGSLTALQQEYSNPEVAATRDPLDKYSVFKENDNEIKIFLRLSPDQQGEFSTFEPQGQAFKTRYDPTNVVGAPMPNIDSFGPFGSGLVGRFTSRLENRD